MTTFAVAPAEDLWSIGRGEKVLLTIGILLTLLLIGVFIFIIRMARKDEE
ncbi:MAG: hypothetical protein KC983_02935 [Phycisphaerales bacterium]|nr:hypothetical protein [Phycisphaerales bacterium]